MHRPVAARDVLQGDQSLARTRFADGGQGQFPRQQASGVEETIDERGEAVNPLSRQKYFSSIEAINLGVVPPDPEQLLHFTMNGAALTKRIRTDLDAAPRKGLCKVVLGHYGTGKTHYLQLARSVALQSGWVVSFVEFDPKAADPAKPHLVYRHLMSALEFPPREDGSVAKGFLGFVKEVRAHWMRADIRHLPLLSKNTWLLEGLHTLLAHNHDEEDERYVAGCSWLAGDKQLPARSTWRPAPSRPSRTASRRRSTTGTSVPASCANSNWQATPMPV